MPLFLATAKVRYDYEHDPSDTENYTEAHLIEAESAPEARKLAQMHYEALNHESSAHHYRLRDLRVTPQLDAAEVRGRHTRVMAEWQEHYAKDHGETKETM